MDVFAEQTHRLRWILFRPHSRLMSKAGGLVLILLWLKPPPQQEIRLAAPGFCPLTQQALCSSLPPPHLSLSLQARLHLHSSIMATIRKGDCADKYAHLQLGTRTCMCFVIVLIRTSEGCRRGTEVGREIKGNLDRSCFVFQEGTSPAASTTTSYVPVMTPGDGLTPAWPLSPAWPCTPACQLIITQTSQVSPHQNMITCV